MSRKNVEEKPNIVSTKKIIIFLVLIIALTAAKIYFLVPTVNQPPAGETCAGLEAKDTYVTLSKYIQSNRSRGCDIYEIKTERYMIENVATFVLLTIIIFTANYFYDKQRLQAKNIRRQNQSRQGNARPASSRQSHPRK